MTALADSLARARREAETALKLRRELQSRPADPASDVTVLAIAVDALAAAVLELADYAEHPF